MVESDAQAVAVIRANIETVGLEGARVTRDRVERVLASRGGPDRYDLVFADPPYAMTTAAVTRLLPLLATPCPPDAPPVVVDAATRSGPVHWPPGYLPGKSRRYGEATFWYGWNGGGTVAGRTRQAPRAALPAHEE